MKFIWRKLGGLEKKITVHGRKENFFPVLLNFPPDPYLLVQIIALIKVLTPQ